MRILRVSHSAAVPAWRGRERALRALGHEIELFAAQSEDVGGAQVVLREGDEAATHPLTRWGRHPALFVFDPRPLWRALGSRWDVIDIHEEPFALATAEILALRALRRNRAPFVLYTAQNLRKRYPIPFRWFERSALRGASGVSACNTEAAAIAEDKGFPGRAQVIPLGVDLAEFAPEEARTPDQAAVHVGFVGRLVEEKGVWVLMDAVATAPSLRLRIGGSGPLAAQITDRARALGIADRVELRGSIAPGDMPEFYRSVDVVAVPSLATPSWTEQFGRVAVEAMACGTPVVSSDAGALPDVVGGAGFVTPEGDADALARALLAAAGVDRERLRAAGLARAAICSWPCVAQAYDRLYRFARHEPRPSPGVEVVVVAYGRPDLLRAAVSPLSHLPVTVVDNSSLPEIAALCEELGVRCIDPGRNGGFAAGVNIALADPLVPGADVLLLNPDARISAEDVDALHAALRADVSLASVGPSQRDDEGTSARVLWPFPRPALAWLEALGMSRLWRGAPYVIGSVLLLRSEALDQVGGFDERFFLYAEEADWAYRAHRLGWAHAEVTSVRAVHVGAATSTDPARRDSHFYASQERYYRKHFGALGWRSAQLAAWCGATLRGVLLRGERARAARDLAARYRRGPVRVESEMAGVDG